MGIFEKLKGRNLSKIYKGAVLGVFVGCTAAICYLGIDDHKNGFYRLNGAFNRIRSWFSGSEEDMTLRTINLTVAADEELIDCFGSSQACFSGIEYLVDKLSEEYKKEFGIEFKIKNYSIYDSEDNFYRNYQRMREVCSEVGNCKTDFRIAFTGQEMERTEKEITCGVAGILCNAAIVYLYPEMPLNRAMLTLVHEVGHVFGCNHVDELGYIMNASLTDIEEVKMASNFNGNYIQK